MYQNDHIQIVDEYYNKGKAFLEKMSRNSWFWTSATYPKNVSQAWIVYFDDGNDSYSSKSNASWVRCVR